MAMLPTNPSATITSALPAYRSFGSTLPTKPRMVPFRRRAVSLTSSSPLPSSSPLLSRPTVGSGRPILDGHDRTQSGTLHASDAALNEQRGGHDRARVARGDPAISPALFAETRADGH